MDSSLIKNENKDILQLTESSQSYLKETSSWTFFFSILGFIFLGLLFIGAITVSIMFSVLDNENMPAISGLTLGLLYITICIVLFFPVYYLYKFSSNMKTAIENNEINNLETALRNIKSHFKFMGYFTIIIIVIYVFAAIMMLFTGMLTNFWQ
jgi:hypothetical protein